MMTDKKLYETLGALAESLPAHQRVELALIVLFLVSSNRTDTRITVRRWVRESGLLR